MRSQTPNKSIRRHNNSFNKIQPKFTSNNPLRSISPRPNHLKIFNDNLERSQLSRNHSDFDSMLSNIRPSRPNSNRSMKYRSDYDPNKKPRRSCLKKGSISQGNSIGINLGFNSTWEQFNDVNDSLRGNSFTINGDKSRKMNRHHLQMKPNKTFHENEPRWIKNSKEKSIIKKNVSFTEKPKVIYVENWKILNVDMSKEGKLYNKFNRGNKSGDESCRVF
jgi:hypothetical protein